MADLTPPRQRILDYLAEHGRSSPSEIAEGTGRDYDNTKMLLHSMVKDDQIERVARGQYAPKGYTEWLEEKEEELRESGESETRTMGELLGEEFEETFEGDEESPPGTILVELPERSEPPIEEEGITVEERPEAFREDRDITGLRTNPVGEEPGSVELKLPKDRYFDDEIRLSAEELLALVRVLANATVPAPSEKTREAIETLEDELVRRFDDE